MKYHSFLLPVFFVAIVACHCSLTCHCSPGNFLNKRIPKSFGQSLNGKLRCRRSLAVSNPTLQIPCNVNPFWGQEGPCPCSNPHGCLLTPEYLVAPSSSNHDTFHHQQPFLPSPLDHSPHEFVNPPEHLVSAAGLSAPNMFNEVQPKSAIPDSFNLVPIETQLESPILSQTQENMFFCKDPIPPTLHQSPHDIFPDEGQPIHPEEQPVLPDEPKLSITFEGFGGSQDPKIKILDQSETELHHYTKHNDGGTREMDSSHNINGQVNCDCGVAHDKIDIKQSKIILKVKVNGECSNGETSCSEHGHSDSQKEEDCGKIMTSSVECKPQGILRNGFPNTCTSNDGFGKINKDITKLIDKNEGQQKQLNINNITQILTNEQFSDLKMFLSEMIKNQQSDTTYESGSRDSKKRQRSNSYKSNSERNDKCSCFNKLCKCLEVAKNVGDFISDKARQALRGIGGLTTEEPQNYDCDCSEEIRHSFFH